MNAAEITDKLGLHSLRQRAWYIQAACATSGDGLYEGLEWVGDAGQCRVDDSCRPTSRSADSRARVDSCFYAMRDLIPSQTLRRFNFYPRLLKQVL